ncbi:hypothetical protein BH10ACT3_BH10ACT3_15940 [soil metagenome]
MSHRVTQSALGAPQVRSVTIANVAVPAFEGTRHGQFDTTGVAGEIGGQTATRVAMNER